MVILLVFSEVLYKGRYLVLLSKEFGNSFFGLFWLYVLKD